MSLPGPPSKRTILGYGAIPQPLDEDSDTEPNLFAVSPDEATKPRCYMCGKSTWAYDDGFEAGVAYALTQTQGLLQTGTLGQKLSAAEAETLTNWLRSKIQAR